MRKKVLILILIIIIIVIIGYAIINKPLIKYRKAINSINIEEINLSNVEDGTYIGESDAVLVKVKVKVTVENNKIKDIELLKHENGRGENAEVVVDRVIKHQSLDVDVVSGATSSSKVILDAIQNALKKN